MAGTLEMSDGDVQVRPMELEMALLFFELEVGVQPPADADRRVLVDARSHQIVALDLSNLRLTELQPQLLEGLSQLKRLDLSNNNLATIPETIARLKLLRRLDLENNRLRTVPNTIGHLIHLRYLHLGGNKLTVLPEILAQLKKLRELHLEGNQLRTLPRSIIQLETLRELYITSNPRLRLSKEQKAWLADLEKNDCQLKR